MTEDKDPIETREWMDALDAVSRYSGPERAAELLIELAKHATETGVRLPTAITTPFRNTIAPRDEKLMPGDLFMERRIRSLVRWNALAMVMRANDNDEGLGGHISSFSSSATLYDVGFNYFFRGNESGHPGDLVFYQGHSAPGMYARSYLEGRLTEEQLDNFRREVDGNGLSSYPHPWLMPDYWQFPTVSMGLGPIQAIYQAHVMKYQQSRGLLDHGDRNVWCFLGDGECDEPESLGAISMAGRERLGNLIFVVNAAPVGMSSRSSGAASGTRCWKTTTAACCSSAWTKCATASCRTTNTTAVPIPASISSASTRKPWNW